MFQLCQDCPECENTEAINRNRILLDQLQAVDLAGRRIGDTIQVRAPQRYEPIPQQTATWQWQPWVPENWDNIVTVTTTNQLYETQAQVAGIQAQIQAQTFNERRNRDNFWETLGGNTIGRATAANRNTEYQEHEEPTF